MLDPLSVNVSVAGVETTMPILPEADYDFQIVESAAVPNKEQSGLNWKLKLALVNPAVGLDGREIAPTFPVFATFALQARPDSTDPDAFKRSLGEAIDAIFNSTKENRPNLNKALIDDAVGKHVRARIVVDTYQGNQNNKVKRLLKHATA